MLQNLTLNLFRNIALTLVVSGVLNVYGIDTSIDSNSQDNGVQSACFAWNSTDLSCAVFVARQIPVLKFNSSVWNENDFYWYLAQDGLYMRDYGWMVTYKAQNLCAEVSTEAVKIIENNLNFTLNMTEYEQRYQLSGLTAVLESPEFLEYKRHYESKTECFEMISAMLPCLCLYPALATEMQDEYDPAYLTERQLSWLEDNSSSGTTCRALTQVLGDKLHHGSYLYSMALELKFFNQRNPNNILNS